MPIEFNPNGGQYDAQNSRKITTPELQEGKNVSIQLDLQELDEGSDRMNYHDFVANTTSSYQ